ncbi:MAG: hypothetical protein A2017_20940 [Lentisphaerae bacterium GWF2_44_16]|nr:MAG: hypothetical protein A2017_20940 [Lentisphaerae bacterium GWF2_44_16]
MINPYKDVNWKSVQRIASATHMHISSQNSLDNACKYGIRHFPVSNYYPSAPYDANTKISNFRLRQSWPVKRHGLLINPPVNWNDIITWQSELEDPYKSNFPFTECAPLFKNIPENIILSNNAEHHGFTNMECHICSPGSSFISGNFDSRGHYHLDKHGFSVGFGGRWQDGFKDIFDKLDYPDEGGIVICHPTWFSRIPDTHIMEMLDFDERVLGIEIYNDYSGRRDWSKISGYHAPPESKPGFSLNLWDRILKTGRKCWGFCVPDHSVEKGGNWNGRNILLVSNFTDRDCLKAYRQGQFYGSLKDSGLTVRNFAVTENSISVEVNISSAIKFITENGIVNVVEGKKGEYKIPMKNNIPDILFVRVEIEDNSGERLFLQPVMNQKNKLNLNLRR